MIHPGDWDVLLRWPRTTTILETLLFITIAALIVFAIYAYIIVAGGKPLRTRTTIFAAGWIVGGFSILALANGIQTRINEARCWRLGPEGMPSTDRTWCEAMPPEGNENMYFNTIFGPSKR